MVEWKVELLAILKAVTKGFELVCKSVVGKEYWMVDWMECLRAALMEM